MKDNMKISQKSRGRYGNDPTIPPLETYSSKIKSAYKEVICTSMFISAQFTVTKIGTQPDVHQLMLDKGNVVYTLHFETELLFFSPCSYVVEMWYCGHLLFSC